MPPKRTVSPCLECFKRSRTNSSGRSRCSGGNPCKWCKNNRIVCTYDYQPEDSLGSPTAVPSLPPTPVVAQQASNIQHPAPAEDKRMFVLQHSNGSVSVRFVPDPENIGTVDPDELGEGNIDPYTLPSENYNILVNAFKRKRLDQVKPANFTLPVAKRIRGGLDQALDEGEGDQGPPPPPPPQEEDRERPADPETPRVMQNLIETSTAAVLALTQVVTDMRRDNNKGTDRQSTRDKRIHRLDLIEEDEVLSKVDAMIPWQMHRVFEQGWKVDFSMYMLTDDYCESPEAKKVAADKLFVGQGNNIITQPAELSLVNKDPTTLTLAHFMQAAPRFIILLKTYFGEDLARAWQAHCDFILGHSRREKIWHLLMTYDATI
ncbi:unnamed protein product, partial [Rhizoctonia solani]